MKSAMRWRSLPSQGLKKLIAARCPQGLSSRVPFLRAVVDHQDSLSLDDVVAFMANQGIVALPQAGRPSASASSVEIKCLLFLNAGAPLLIILPVQDRVSEPALAAFLGVPKSRLSMAPVNALVSLCGFPVGAVPPFGHRTPLPTIVDDTVVAHSHVVFGPSNEFVVACAELLRVSQATVGPISVASTSAASNGTHSTEAVICAEWDSPQMPIPWKPGAQAVKMGGVIVQKRNIAKLLLFANIIPPLTQALPRPGSPAYLRRLWAHPETGAPCEVQLILGKTLERRLGREAAVRLFKSLRVGQAVEVTGRPQAHPDPAAGMKRTVATLDVVVHDIRVVSEAALRTDSEGEGQVGPNGACLESMPEDSISTAPNTGLPMEQVSREVERTQFRAKAVLETSLGPVYTKNVERVHIVAGLPGIELMRRALLSPPVASTTAPALTATEDRSAPVHSDPAEGGSLPDSATTSGDSEQRQRNRGRHHRRAAAMVPTGWRPRVVLGMDCEWQPSSRAEPNTPVSVLQIGSTHDVFLIDLLALCAAGRPAEGAALPAEQEALSEVLAAVFADKDIVKVGFGLRYDLERLVESYPWLPCFGGLTAQHCATAETLHASTASTDTVENGVMPDCSSSSVVPSAVSSVPFASHVDLRLLARAAGDGHTSFKRMGLAQLCHHVLGVHLDKGEQRSDWGNRPLSQEQVDYAAADVCCLVDMFNVIIARRTDLLASYWMDQFAASLTDISALKVRRSRQSNYAFGITPPSNNRLGASLPRQAIVVSRSDGTTAEAVCNLPALMQHLGQSVPGNGRLGVVQLATSELEADSSAGGSNGGQRVPHFPRGSGVLEMSNAFILFVNVPSTAYPNAFSVREDTSTGEAVCEMSWWSSKGQTVNHPVMRRLLGPAVRALLPAQTSASGSEEGEEVEHVDEPARAVLLFCRPLKEAYVLCGRLEASEVEECEDGRLRVEWRLMDFGSLRTSAHFQRVMQLQAGVV